MRGVERPVIATCGSWSAGRCLEPLCETVVWPAQSPPSRCRHDKWGAPRLTLSRRIAGESRLGFTSRRTGSSHPAPTGVTARVEMAVRASRDSRRGSENVRAEVSPDCVCGPLLDARDATRSPGINSLAPRLEWITTYTSAKAVIRCARRLASARSATDLEPGDSRRS